MVNPDVFNQKPAPGKDFKANFNKLKKDFKQKNLTQNLEDSPPGMRNRFKHTQSLQQDSLQGVSIQEQRSL